MEFQVLARRYRPRRFDEVVGQEAVAATLRGAIVQDRIAHAYLFTGPRGTGKTSMARIFAKALNCPNASGDELPREEWGNPCNECDVCDGIHVGQEIDVVEMDGASHRGIEDVRSIIESVSRPATRSRYKIFIVDEVHMLTREAFNALLKTLEEPPSHVKFLFATTEAHRIPDTVLSRCQRFDFHPIGVDAIVRRLGQILELEGREAEAGLLDKIAAGSRGGLRDSQTLLDQLLTFSDGVLRSDDLDRVTGRAPGDLLTTLCEAIETGDVATVVEQHKAAHERGADPAVLLEQTIETLHARVREVVAQDSGEDLDAGELDRRLGVVQILLETAGRLRQSAFPAVAVEVALLKAARLENPSTLEEIIGRLRAIESGGAVATRVVEVASSAPVGRPAGVESHAPSGHGSAGSSRSGPSDGSSLGGDGPGVVRNSVPPDTSVARDVARAPEDQRHVMESSTSASPSGAESTSQASLRETAPAAVATLEEPTPDVSERESSSGQESPVDFSRLLSVWGQVVVELQEKHPQVAAFLGDRGPVAADGGKATIVFDDDFSLTRMRAASCLEALESLARDITGAKWKFELTEVAPAGAVVPAVRAASPASAPAPAVASSAPAGPSDGAGDVSGVESEASNSSVSQPPPATPPAPGSARLIEHEVVVKARKLFNADVVRP